ncbi:integumentary mucin C.1-like [Camelus ferus]|uniref:Integumentary mucin C.1-like n=1 Tax=Camelus ferus TaxID=419612 RepID=A0A8B8T7C8_CAMFR|nr:integumentary mucin C.1-like [Camelus ferus]
MNKGIKEALRSYAFYQTLKAKKQQKQILNLGKVDSKAPALTPVASCLRPLMGSSAATTSAITISAATTSSTPVSTTAFTTTTTTATTALTNTTTVTTTTTATPTPAITTTATTSITTTATASAPKDTKTTCISLAAILYFGLILSLWETKPPGLFLSNP